MILGRKQNEKLRELRFGNWIKGDGDGTPLYNAINGEQIGTVGSKGLDFSEMMNYMRKLEVLKA